MRSILFFLTIILVTVSCGQNDAKEKEPELKENQPALQEKAPEQKTNDTAAAANGTPETVVGEKEISVVAISKGDKSIPAFHGPAVYLHFKKVIDGSYVFIAKANEWGVMNINGKITKLMYVKGNEDGATYSNADYEMSYDLSYLNAPAVENPTVECTIRIKGKGYPTYRNKIWGEWGEN